MATIDQCMALLRAAEPLCLARALLRTEPFASAEPLAGVYLHDGTFRDDIINPWDAMAPLLNAVAVFGAVPRPVSLARYYAHGVVDPRAVPRDTSRQPAMGSVPTFARTPACDAAWARWALDAVDLALADPATRPSVAAAVARMCAEACVFRAHPPGATHADPLLASYRSLGGR